MRKLINSPIYISNFTQHSDLQLKTINDKIFLKDFTTNYSLILIF